jgi:hypothetical protein
MSGSSEADVRLRDEAGRERELILTGVPKQLRSALLPGRHRATLTLVEGELCIAAIQVR